MFPTPIHPTEPYLVASKVEKNGASQDGALPVDNAAEVKVSHEDVQNQETIKSPNSVISLWGEVLSWSCVDGGLVALAALLPLSDTCLVVTLSHRRRRETLQFS